MVNYASTITIYSIQNVSPTGRKAYLRGPLYSSLIHKGTGVDHRGYKYTYVGTLRIYTSLNPLERSTTLLTR